MPAKNIRVTAEVWGAGPGMGGTSYIEFKLNGEIYDVFAGGTSFDGRENLGEVKLSDGWRGRVSYIVEQSPPYHEEKSPDDIVVRGAKGIENQLLAAAWSGEAGAEFVGLMLELDDAEIENLIEQSHHDLAGAIDAVARARLEVNSDDEEILNEIKNLIRSDSMIWEKLLSTLVGNQARNTSKRVHEALLAKANRDKNLEPFQSQINQAVKDLILLESNKGINVRIEKINGLRIFLEDFVINNGHFPSGIITVNYISRQKHGAPIEAFFDFDLHSIT